MTSPDQPAAAIRPMNDDDWPAVQRIYGEGIATGHAAFAAEPPGWEQFNMSRLPRHRFVGTIQASIFPENEASLKLHLANGYVVVGRRQRIGPMAHGPLSGQWRDTVLIERRSPAI